MKVPLLLPPPNNNVVPFLSSLFSPLLLIPILRKTVLLFSDAVSNVKQASYVNWQHNFKTKIKYAPSSFAELEGSNFNLQCVRWVKLSKMSHLTPLLPRVHSISRPWEQGLALRLSPCSRTRDSARVLSGERSGEAVGCESFWALQTNSINGWNQPNSEPIWHNWKPKNHVAWLWLKS